MRPIRSFVVLIALLALGLVGTALPAAAHVQRVVINETVVEQADGDLVVRGGITCTAGERFQIIVEVQQSMALARGITTGVCSGSPQDWVLEARLVRGNFDPGPATACANAQTFDASGAHGSQTTCQTVQIVNP